MLDGINREIHAVTTIPDELRQLVRDEENDHPAQPEPAGAALMAGPPVLTGA